MKAEFSKTAIKFIEKLDSKSQHRIRIKLRLFISLVEEHGILPVNEYDIKFLKGSWKPLKRMRIGNFRVIFDTDPSQARLRYIGKERDEESLLADHGVRKYDYDLGRFTCPDPMGEKSDKIPSPSERAGVRFSIPRPAPH
jgi:RHS repeat-associated protein